MFSASIYSLLLFPIFGSSRDTACWVPNWLLPHTSKLRQRSGVTMLHSKKHLSDSLKLSAQHLLAFLISSDIFPFQRKRQFLHAGSSQLYLKAGKNSPESPACLYSGRVGWLLVSQPVELHGRDFCRKWCLLYRLSFRTICSLQRSICNMFQSSTDYI